MTHCDCRTAEAASFLIKLLLIRDYADALTYLGNQTVDVMESRLSPTSVAARLLRDADR